MKPLEIYLLNEPETPDLLFGSCLVTVDPNNKELIKFLGFGINENSMDKASRIENDETENGKSIKVDFEVDHFKLLKNMGIDPHTLYTILKRCGEVSFDFKGEFGIIYRMPGYHNQE